VPQEILWRRDKVGFETPETEWLDACLTQMPDLFHDDAEIRDYIEPVNARTLVQNWLARKTNTGSLWRLINLELWLQAFSGRYVGSPI
jgi:hypothetical protein